MGNAKEEVKRLRSAQRRVFYTEQDDEPDEGAAHPSAKERIKAIKENDEGGSRKRSAPRGNSPQKSKKTAGGTREGVGQPSSGGRKKTTTAQTSELTKAAGKRVAKVRYICLVNLDALLIGLFTSRHFRPKLPWIWRLNWRRRSP